jgi:hypothetical protein
MDLLCDVWNQFKQDKNAVVIEHLFTEQRDIGKVNMEHQLDATITVFLDLQDQLNMFRASFCPSSGAQD